MASFQQSTRQVFLRKRGDNVSVVVQPDACGGGQFRRWLRGTLPLCWRNTSFWL